MYPRLRHYYDILVIRDETTVPDLTHLCERLDGRRLGARPYLFNPIRFAVYPRSAIARHHGCWSTYQRTVLQIPVSKFSSARQPSSRSSLEASMA